MFDPHLITEERQIYTVSLFYLQILVSVDAIESLYSSFYSDNRYNKWRISLPTISVESDQFLIAMSWYHN